MPVVSGTNGRCTFHRLSVEAVAAGLRRAAESLEAGDSLAMIETTRLALQAVIQHRDQQEVEIVTSYVPEGHVFYAGDEVRLNDAIDAHVTRTPPHPFDGDSDDDVVVEEP